MSLRWVKHGIEPVAARRKAIWVSALGSLITLLLPFATDARWATTIISISFFFALAGSVNIYAIPIDLYGAARSGLAISALTCAYGVLQTVISPIIGYLSDHKLYTEVVWIVTVPPILSSIVLMGVRQETGGCECKLDFPVDWLHRNGDYDDYQSIHPAFTEPRRMGRLCRHPVSSRQVRGRVSQL